jgi:anti-anti-sigma factor
MYGIITYRNEFTANLIRSEIAGLRKAVEGLDDIIIDISDVRTFDTAAIQLLVAAKKECMQRGHEMILRKSKEAARLLKSLGIDL